MDDYARQLGLDSEGVYARARFLDRYGDQATEHIEYTEVTSADWRRIAPKAVAASAYIDSLTLFLLVKMDEARKVALKAVARYIELDMPMGIMLSALFRFELPTREKATKRILGLVPLEHSVMSLETPNALAYPEQQLTLAIALLLDQNSAREYSDRIQQVLTALNRDHALTPFGAQGLPLWRYLEVARTLLSMAGVSESAESKLRTLVETVWPRLHLLSAIHYGSVEAARYNSFLWKSVHAPVTFVDIELLALMVGLLRLVDFRQPVGKSIVSPLLERESRDPRRGHPAGVVFDIASELA